MGRSRTQTRVHNARIGLIADTRAEIAEIAEMAEIAGKAVAAPRCSGRN